VHLAGISAGAAMATLLGVAYPEQFLSITSVAGIAWRGAVNVGQALTVMQQGAGEALPDAAALRAALGTGARVPRVLVVHGAKDNVVSIRNADETVRQFAGVHEAIALARGTGPLERVELPATIANGYTVRETQWRDADGMAQVTLLRVDELGHAFPRGDAAGTFTDPSGPDLVERLRVLIAGAPPTPRH
jgi:poly(3-hydroxybutyrate) depolymerase